MNNYTACAGFTDKTAAYRAKVNHFGNSYVPERPFVDAVDVSDANIQAFADSLVADIKQNLEIQRETAARGIAGAKAGMFKRGYDRMKDIATQMEAQQYEAWFDWASNGGNAERTIEKKGFDAPLYDTGYMVSNHKSWVGDRNGRKTSIGRPGGK